MCWSPAIIIWQDSRPGSGRCRLFFENILTVDGSRRPVHQAVGFIGAVIEHVDADFFCKHSGDRLVFGFADLTGERDPTRRSLGFSGVCLCVEWQRHWYDSLLIVVSQTSGSPVHIESQHGAAEGRSLSCGDRYEGAHHKTADVLDIRLAGLWTSCGIPRWFRWCGRCSGIWPLRPPSWYRRWFPFHSLAAVGGGVFHQSYTSRVPPRAPLVMNFSARIMVSVRSRRQGWPRLRCRRSGQNGLDIHVRGAFILDAEVCASAMTGIAALVSIGTWLRPPECCSLRRRRGYKW